MVIYRVFFFYTVHIKHIFTPNINTDLKKSIYYTELYVKTKTSQTNYNYITIAQTA